MSLAASFPVNVARAVRYAHFATDDISDVVTSAGMPIDPSDLTTLRRALEDARDELQRSIRALTWAIDGIDTSDEEGLILEVLEEDDDDDDDDDTVCEGHESLRGDLMGESFYCDGSCQ